MKRIIFCFDGSWNKLNAAFPTNVVLIAESIATTDRKGIPQIVYYDEGVGTTNDEKLRGGAFGKGLLINITDAYRFLIFNYEPGDEIYAFGFSRGAFTARSFIGFIQCAGILDINDASKIDQAVQLYRDTAQEGPHGDRARGFRAKHAERVCLNDEEERWRCRTISTYMKGSAHQLKIRYVGVWDTVAALGWPRIVPGADKLNQEHRFHNANLTGNVEAARHAVAIDEKRILFAPTLWTNIDALNRERGFLSSDPSAPYQQKWFPGDHGSIGGGGPERGLSDDPFGWVLAGAKALGLQLNVGDTSRIYEIRPDYNAPLSNNPDWEPWHDRGPIGWIKKVTLTADRSGPRTVDEVSQAAIRRWNSKGSELQGTLYRPKTLAHLAKDIEASGQAPEVEFKGYLAEHVVARGESLRAIAKRFYGKADLASVIFDANPDVLDDINDIHVGAVLKIPILDGADHALKPEAIRLA